MNLIRKTLARACILETDVRIYIQVKKKAFKTRKWFPLQGELAPVTKYVYFLIKNKPILVHSMLAAGIVQDTFAGEAVEGEGGEEELLVATSTATNFYWYILPLMLESLPFLSS